MKEILKTTIFIIIIIISLLLSMIGWQPLKKSFVPNKKKNLQLAENLKNHVYKLSHLIGDRSVFKYDKLNEAAEYIAEQFSKNGYKVDFQEYRVLNKTVKNIIATKVGNSESQAIIIVGAHYDTCSNPGADDNASAVAGLLELARTMASKPTERTIKFIAFVNEEPPFFKTKEMGSYVYAKEARERKEKIKAVIILEMIGYYTDKRFSQKYPPFFGPFYPNKGNFIGVVGNFKSKWLVRQVSSSFKKQSSFPIKSMTTFAFIPGVDFSDHWSFWKENYDAVMITDTAFYRNSNYHKNSDTYDTLNYHNIAEVVEGFNTVLMDLVN